MKSQARIAIVDYGISNLRSITEAVGFFTDNFFLVEDPSGLELADAVVLPGVGAFEEGMKGLVDRNLVGAIKNFAASGKPILGICLGAQLLLSKGYEFGVFDGLNIIPGRVVRFPMNDRKIKIPHIGWNGIYPGKSVWEESILKNIPTSSAMYFVHSYILEPDDKKHILSFSNYEGYEFCSMIGRGNIYGCQFHPEKSGEAGLKIIENFVTLSENRK